MPFFSLPLSYGEEMKKGKKARWMCVVQSLLSYLQLNLQTSINTMCTCEIVKTTIKYSDTKQIQVGLERPNTKERKVFSGRGPIQDSLITIVFHGKH
jgi:hypothetical protein